MKRIALLPVAAAAFAVVYGTALFAETAPSTPPSQKTDTKSKAKPAPVQVEGSYSAEADAKRACGAAPVVWVNTSSKIYHAAGTRDYGKTKRGFYMCQAMADKSGFRAVKSSQKKKQ